MMTSRVSPSCVGRRESSTARGSLGRSPSSGRTCHGERRVAVGPAGGDAAETLRFSECVQHD